MSRILIVQDDRRTLGILASVLRTEGYKVVSVSGDAEEASVAGRESPSIMVADIGEFSRDRIAALMESKRANPSMAVIVIANEIQDIAPIVDGDLFALLRKPFKMEDIVGKIREASDSNERALAEKEHIKFELETVDECAGIVAESQAMRDVTELIARIAATDVAVMISGEAGTEKDAVARTIHDRSMRGAKSFAVFDCSGAGTGDIVEAMLGKADRPGTIESADGGSLFLKDVDSMPRQAQPPLLQALQNRRVRRVGSRSETAVDVRVISSVVDAEGAVESGLLKRELVRHLRAIEIAIPPLRDRRQDIRPLAQRAVRICSGEKGSPMEIDPAALDLMEKYDWPGNVRELEDAVSCAAARAKLGKLTADSLPPAIRE